MNISRTSPTPKAPQALPLDSNKESITTQKKAAQADINSLFSDPLPKNLPSLSKRAVQEGHSKEAPHTQATRGKFKGFVADIFFNNRSNQLNVATKEVYDNAVDKIKGRLNDNSLLLKKLSQEITNSLNGSELSVEKFITLLLHDSKIEMHPEVRQDLLKLHGQHLADRFTPLNSSKVHDNLISDDLKAQRNTLLEVIDYVSKSVDADQKANLKGIKTRVSDEKISPEALKQEMKALGSSLRVIASQDTHKYSKKMIKSFVDLFAQMKSGFMDCFRANVSDSFPKALVMSFFAMGMEFLNAAIVDLRDGKSLNEGVRENLMQIGEWMQE